MTRSLFYRRDPSSVFLVEGQSNGIRRCIAADRDLNADPERTSNSDEPVLGNLGDSLPEPLAFVSNKPLSVSHVSKTPGFGDAQDSQNGGNS